MKKISLTIGGLLVVAAMVASMIGFALIVLKHHHPVAVAQAVTIAPVQPVGPVLDHQQETWVAALEWCESRGVSTAVNPKDRDGTPSYYSFQFKPGTFQSFGIHYGVIPKGTTAVQTLELMKSYDLQKQIVGYMVLDKKTNWYQQFPDCVKRKIGLPPL